MMVEHNMLKVLPAGSCPSVLPMARLVKLSREKGDPQLENILGPLAIIEQIFAAKCTVLSQSAMFDFKTNQLSSISIFIDGYQFMTRW